MSEIWRKALLGPEQSIREALKVIDEGALRFALVVDHNMQLVGVTTDGDIRRGLINNADLEDSVSTVMNRRPTVAPSSMTRRELVRLMEKSELLAIPLVDNGKLVGLESLQKGGRRAKYENPVFLMAGGFGTRLYPLTQNCPKPLLEVGGKPLLEILLDNFIKAGFYQFYISTHFMPEKIQEHFGDGSKWGVNIHYIHEEEPLGTGGALGLLDNEVDLPIVVINGDVLTNIDFEQLLKFHNDNQAAATMCVRDYEYQIPFGVINAKDKQVLSMEEKPLQRCFVNAGVYVVSPEVQQRVPKGKKIDMPTILGEVINDDWNVLMFPVHDYWLDIGRMEDYNKAQIDILNIGF